MTAKKALHFGLNRSGTNYLKELMLTHFNIEFLNKEGERDHPLHKHFRLYDNKSLIGRPNFKNDLVFNSFSEYESMALEGQVIDLYLIISKDPYSWHLSYKSWGKKNNWGSPPHPYVLEYNEFHRKWLDFSKETSRIHFVRYIDLLTDKSSVLQVIRDKYDLEIIKEIDTPLSIKKVPMSHRFSDKKARYYTEFRYLQDFSKEELNEINRNIDHDLVAALGYQSYFSKT